MNPNQPAQASWRRVFANRHFQIIFAAELVSTFGDVLHKLALMWYIYSVTGSALSTGGVAIAGLLAPIVAGLPIGALVDRWNRKTIMIASDLVRAALVAAMVLAMIVSDQPPLWFFYLGSFGLSFAAMFFGPARSAALPDLLDRETLLGANVAASMLGQIMAVAYTAIGGLLIASIGPIWAMAINAVSFVGSAIWLTRLPSLAREPRPQAAGARPSMLADIREGVAYMRSTAFLSALLSVVVMVNFGSALYSSLLPALVAGSLGGTPALYGTISTAMIVGSLLGGLVIQPIARRLSMSALIAIGLSGAGLSAIAIGWSRLTPLVVVLYGLMSFALVFNQMPVYTLLQRETPSHLRGRVFNLFGLVATIANPLGIALGSLLADKVGVGWVYSAGGLIVLFGALQLGRRFQAPQPAQPAPAAEGAA